MLSSYIALFSDNFQLVTGPRCRAPTSQNVCQLTLKFLYKRTDVRVMQSHKQEKYVRQFWGRFQTFCRQTPPLPSSLGHFSVAGEGLATRRLSCSAVPADNSFHIQIMYLRLVNLLQSITICTHNMFGVILWLNVVFSAYS